MANIINDEIKLKLDGVMKAMSSQLSVAMQNEGDKLAQGGITELKYIHSEIKLLKAAVEKINVDMFKINTLTGQKLAKIEELNSNIRRNTDKAKEASKIASLQWAMSHSDIGEFYYQDHDVDNVCSRKFVQTILGGFMLNSGTYISKHLKFKGSSSRFEEEVTTQIHCLTGVRPRISYDKDEGKRYIWYN